MNAEQQAAEAPPQMAHMPQRMASLGPEDLEALGVWKMPTSIRGYHTVLKSGKHYTFYLSDEDVGLLVAKHVRMDRKGQPMTINGKPVIFEEEPMEATEEAPDPKQDAEPQQIMEGDDVDN